MNKLINILLTLLPALLSTSCNDHADFESLDLTVKRIDVRIAPYHTATGNDNAIPQEWSAYLFQDGILSEMYMPLSAWLSYS